MDGVGSGRRPPGWSRVGDRLERLCLDCRQQARADGVGLAILAADGTAEPVFMSDRLSRLIEDLQFTLGEGPCVDAVSSGSPVLIEDLQDPSVKAQRWPAFISEVHTAGIAAVFAFPIRLGAIALGTLDLYRSAPGWLEPAELAAVLRTVDHLGSVLLDLGATGADRMVEPAYRVVVHQAAGMVMVQLQTSIETALARLRATAFSEAIPINDLAADVVSGRRRFSEEKR